MVGSVVPRRTYLIVFVALIILTAITVAIAFVDLGPFHLVAALAIAGAKASLVVLFFMQVLYSSRLVWIAVLSALFWLSILILLTMNDYLTRTWMVY